MTIYTDIHGYQWELKESFTLNFNTGGECTYYYLDSLEGKCRIAVAKYKLDNKDGYFKKRIKK